MRKSVDIGRIRLKQRHWKYRYRQEEIGKDRLKKEEVGGSRKKLVEIGCKWQKWGK